MPLDGCAPGPVRPRGGPGRRQLLDWKDLLPVDGAACVDERILKGPADSATYVRETVDRPDHFFGEPRANLRRGH